MILSPLQNTAKDNLQVRPFVTQGFGERPEYYKKYGMNGHNGIDFRAPVGTPIFAGFEGIAHVTDSGNVGYGLHVEIWKPNGKLLTAHLSKVFIKDGQKVYMGDKIGLSGNSGDSSAPHLHVTAKKTDDQGKTLDYNNGFLGAYDFADKLITWKGGLMVTDF
jgi:murein DD-endopeptidase MepM/ murein hydrolase activator NlpD